MSKPNRLMGSGELLILMCLSCHPEGMRPRRIEGELARLTGRPITQTGRQLARLCEKRLVEPDRWAYQITPTGALAMLETLHGIEALRAAMDLAALSPDPEEGQTDG